MEEKSSYRYRQVDFHDIHSLLTCALTIIAHVWPEIERQRYHAERRDVSAVHAQNAESKSVHKFMQL
jgi:hypothetical protein